MRLENEKLKDENASLRKNEDLNSVLPQLAEENLKLRNENKVLRVQNDALCGKIISDNDKKSEHHLAFLFLTSRLSPSIVFLGHFFSCFRVFRVLALFSLACNRKAGKENECGFLVFHSWVGRW
ncbi:hypothetical protein V6N13_048984 [Hibiscus sabdariffa]